MQTVANFNFAGKKALVRVDFNVPLNDRFEITDDTRIKATIPTIQKILKDGGSVVLMSHLGRPKDGPTEKYSLKHLVTPLSLVFGVKVKFATDCISDEAVELANGLQAGEILLLENLRFYKEQNREVRCVTARFAEFRKTALGWRWTFREGRDLRFDPATGALMAQPRFKELTLPDYDDDPEVMFYSTKDPDKLSLREVSRFVDQAGSNPGGQNAAYAMRYHSILSAPVICLIVVAVAIPFSVRAGRISPMVGVAKTFGLFLTFYFLTSFCSAFGESGALPPMIAAWIPTVLAAAWVIPKLRSVN